jgi:antirestriction protein ArdC
MSSVYDIVTERIVQQLEKGVVPWRRPWGGPEGAPRNADSRRPYRGVNVFLLSAASYDSPFWLTYRQADKWGGHVRKGEKGFPVVFWTEREKPDEEGLVRKQFVLRYYTVFNAEQCEGLPGKLVETGGPKLDFRPIDQCERILAGLPTDHTAIEHHGGRACYCPGTDRITMPKPERFESAEAYYATLFHELAHSTGHATRLNRPGIAEMSGFGSPSYSREELIAEMGSAFLCGQAGIDVAPIQENAAAYLASWLRVLRADSRLVVQAAAAAQKAADWLLGTSLAAQAEEALTA